LHHPKSFATRKAPAELLTDLDHNDLISILTKLIQEQPDLYNRIEAMTSVPSKSKKKGKKKVDIEVYRRHILSIVHSLDGMRMSEAYWHVGGLANQLREVQESAVKFLDVGDAETALEILLLLLDEASRAIEYIDDSDGELGGYVRQHVLSHFLQAPSSGLQIRPASTPAPEVPFPFLRDPGLARRLAADWHEAKDVMQVRGFKSAVLLAGAVLEATLRALLTETGASLSGSGLAAVADAAVVVKLLPGPVSLPPLLAEYAAQRIRYLAERRLCLNCRDHERHQVGGFPGGSGETIESGAPCRSVA
jgi:hypothetical protein